MYDIESLINHPERLSRDTLYTLRSLVARFPYFQTARLLMLQNLFILHEPDFGKELKRSVFYVADRRVLWQMMNGFSSEWGESTSNSLVTEGEEAENQESPTVDRTLSLIDAFLETLPEQPQTLVLETPASVDYMGMVTLSENDSKSPRVGLKPVGISKETSDVEETEEVLSHTEEKESDSAEKNEEETAFDPDFFTETLARIYIKQKKYDRALEIIRSLYLNFPEKNIYFADQIRFLEKLVKNNNSKKID
ncbi:MAG: tetratricopeptide repeat protein [Bacteroidaceae bacterium]|nr:tetratricopeptide repeat protein [Bacteroidaceae bacterium]